MIGQWFVVFLVSDYLALGLFEVLGIDKQKEGWLLISAVILFFWIINDGVNSYRERHPSKKKLEAQKEEEQRREAEKQVLLRHQKQQEKDRQARKEMIEKRRREQEEQEREEEEKARKRYLDNAENEWDRFSTVHEFSKVDSMSGSEFELAIKIMFQKLGYKAKVTPYTGDFGVDVLITDRHGVVSAIQTKRSKTKVGNRAVMEALAGMKHYGASHAYVLTNASFTKQAIAQAASAGIKLLGRRKLCDLWVKAFPPNDILGKFSLEKYELRKEEIQDALYNWGS